MRRRSTRSMNSSGKSEAPLSSMIDVVFLLLIFFIVVHKPLDVETLLEAGVPSKDKEGRPPLINKPLFTIDVTRLFKNQPVKDLEYYTIKGRLWSLDNIKNLLTKNKTIAKDTTVIINCGPNARHAKLIRLLDICHKAELKNLNIVNNAGIKFEPL